MDSASRHSQEQYFSENAGAAPAKLVFVTGGARSGKSSLALSLARSGRPEKQPAYIATGQAMDTEFANRIEQHKKERKGRFFTVEEGLDISAAFAGVADTYDPIILDCVTTWLGNVFYHKNSGKDGSGPSNVEAFVETEISKLVQNLRDSGSRLIVVSNELGMGLVPADEVSRRYRDVHGRANQHLAAAADEVWFVVSGIPWKLK